MKFAERGLSGCVGSQPNIALTVELRFQSRHSFDILIVIAVVIQCNAVAYGIDLYGQEYTKT